MLRKYSCNEYNETWSTMDDDDDDEEEEEKKIGK
jgi:hypothetical protein